MATTIIYKDTISEVPGALKDGDNLWLPLDELHRSTGWELREEGACIGEMCVPIPAGREAEFLKQDGQMFNLSALHRLLGQPVVHDEAHSVWLFGEDAAPGASDFLALEAPDFSLPDLNGQVHSLSDYRGKKVFLVSWASW